VALLDPTEILAQKCVRLASRAAAAGSEAEEAVASR
jgi:hypothetical protein